MTSASGLPADHPFVGTEGPANMRAAINERFVGHIHATGSRAELAEATRTIIDELMRSTADDSDFDQAALLVVQAAQLLSDRSHDRSYVGGEASLLEGQQKFIDFSPFIGELNPLAPPISVRFEGSEVIGTCTYGAAYEGPPGCLHGGFIAAGFDEILGFAQAFSGRPGMTGNLDISYRSPTPLFQEVTFLGRLDEVDGRKIRASATLSVGDRLCAEAKGLFISMKPEVFERLMALRAASGATPPPG
ncbi:MAG: thioesterase superfamily enzyme [Ilumatobacteraceae bacterium]|nr:thioesterase superfamily enzyme [Ilumatobacteraceae bacterium]